MNKCEYPGCTNDGVIQISHFGKILQCSCDIGRVCPSHYGKSLYQCRGSDYHYAIRSKHTQYLHVVHTAFSKSFVNIILWQDINNAIITVSGLARHSMFMKRVNGSQLFIINTVNGLEEFTYKHLIETCMFYMPRDITNVILNFIIN